MISPSPSGFYDLEARRRIEGIGRVVLVGSGKGGVGKSFIACGLALSLAREGHRTGLFDLDIHGASVPDYLGLRPPIRSSPDGLEPKVAGGVRAMSVALFTGPNPVPMRGRVKDALIAQLLALTNWGTLDYLVVDLPPSTGDELLSALRVFSGRSSLILVTTPSKTSIGVVSRLRRLAATEKIQVEGVALNMSFIRLGKRRAFPFGRLEAAAVHRALDSRLIAEFPLDPAVSSRSLRALLRERNDVSSEFRALARRIARSR